MNNLYDVKLILIKGAGQFAAVFDLKPTRAAL
jgi:hypothetical protein